MTTKTKFISESIVVLEMSQKDRSYHISGQTDAIPGGTFFGLVSPIVVDPKFSEDGRERRAHAAGWITNDKTKAYVVYKDIALASPDTVDVSDSVEVKHVRGT